MAPEKERRPRRTEFAAATAPRMRTRGRAAQQRREIVPQGVGAGLRDHDDAPTVDDFSPPPREDRAG